MTEVDDLVLLERWRTGNAEAGQVLFSRHFDSIYGFFETKCSNEADELTQSTFLACLRAKDQFRADSSFRTYLFTIARNELYRVLRTRQRQGGQIDFNMSSIAQLITTPGSRLARNEEHRSLLEALHQLPIEQQMLLELHYWEEMDIAELAKVFDAPNPTIRTRLHRARKALQKQLENTKGCETLESMDVWAKSISSQDPKVKAK